MGRRDRTTALKVNAGLGMPYRIREGLAKRFLITRRLLGSTLTTLTHITSLEVLYLLNGRLRKRFLITRRLLSSSLTTPRRITILKRLCSGQKNLSNKHTEGFPKIKGIIFPLPSTLLTPFLISSNLSRANGCISHLS